MLVHATESIVQFIQCDRCIELNILLSIFLSGAYHIDVHFISVHIKDLYVIRPCNNTGTSLFLRGVETIALIIIIFMFILLYRPYPLKYCPSLLLYYTVLQIDEK